MMVRIEHFPQTTISDYLSCIKPKLIMTTTERSKEDKIAEIVSGLGFLSYRYLTYEHSIVNQYNNDQQLIDQQKDFVYKLHVSSEVLSENLEKGDTFICDFLGLISQLFAYIWTQPEGDQEQQWRDLREFAMKTEGFSAMMRNMGGDPKEIEDYLEFRCDQHSKIATVIRSLIKDFRFKDDKCQSHERFQQEYKDASAYLFFVYINCQSTIEALEPAIASCLKYDYRYDNSDPAYADEPVHTDDEVIAFITTMLHSMLAEGDKLTRSTQPLTGDALLKKVKSLGDVSKKMLVLQCGYNRGPDDLDEDGDLRPTFTEFYEALLVAKGVTLTSALTEEKAPLTEEEIKNQRLDPQRAFANASAVYNASNIHDVSDLGDAYIDKCVVVGVLNQLYEWHLKAVNDEKMDNRELWRRDAGIINDMKNKLMKIQIGEDDWLFEVSMRAQQQEDAKQAQSLSDESKQVIRSSTTLKPAKATSALPEEIREGIYFRSLSESSADVIEHFGIEAPDLLNKYSCAVEDALIEQVQRANNLSDEVEKLKDEAVAMNQMLTKPEILLDYVRKFFSEDGPYPNFNLEEELKKPLTDQPESPE